MTAHQVCSYGPPVTTDNRPPVTVSAQPAADPEAAPEYEFRVLGHLAPRWSAWFDGLTVTLGEAGTTVLRGQVVDQAALHGLLHKLRDVGIPLISFTQISSPEPTEHSAHTPPKEN